MSASNRVSKLKKRFQDVLSGSVKPDTRSGATLFLEGLCAQDDPAACVEAITESAHGLSSVQSAMRSDLSAQFMNGLGSTVLQYLLQASGVGGDALDSLLFQLVEPPIFWSVFVDTFQQGALTEDAQLVFAHVLSRLLTLQDKDTTPYRDLASQPSIQDSLAASSKQEIREAGHLIKHILSTNTPPTASNIRDGPGGRHDNDFVDYSHIAIIPTADEISCRKPPFLRSTTDDNDDDESEDPVRDYLDNTFRLLREDMIYDIREEVQAALKVKGKKYRGFRCNVSMVGVHTGTNDRKTRWGVKLRCDEDFRQMKEMKEENARVKFLTRDPRGSKILKNQTLVCLVSGQDIVSFGTVNRVEDLLACNPPVIVVQLDSDVNIRKTLVAFSQNQTLQLIQISSAVFAFEPVLTALKKTTVPLSQEIVFWSPGSPIEFSRNKTALSHITNMLVSDPSVDIGGLLNLPKRIQLDPAQAKSLITGLEQRVSLIQGPPGTGKSFIGAILAKAIHDKTSQTMLVVCYTNHALDQFLEDLIKYRIPATSMVRLGGRSSPSTDHLSLNKQPRGRVRQNWEEIRTLKARGAVLETTLESSFERMLSKSLMSHLEREHPEYYDVLYVPPETEDGMTRIGPGGKPISDDYLFLRWKQGTDAGLLSGDPHVQGSPWIWGMAHSARQQLLDRWQEEVTSMAVESICEHGREFNTIQDAVKREFARPTAEMLRQKRIIACTTTGAAIYAETLEQVGPGVLLVEEAGEIFESHILTALSHNVNQMILIGDHKQLRPKVNNYKLSVEKGEGFDLNRSLFERLVLKGYPHVTLATQHRMRNEISAFVRELTYPELIDAPSTHNRPNVRGVQSNIVFINHSHPEDEDTQIADRADGGTKSSKQNTYEVEMVLKIVRYLAQQGYKSDDLVILTPYLGQLQLLRDALKHDNDPVLTEMDSIELARAGVFLSAPVESKGKKSRIHLATIDNYQGEESDIVITSLTRSNKMNSIGFMDSPERLNVLLSRARIGLILIGNSKTFLNSRSGGALWKRFFTLLENGGYVYGGFPVKCDRHAGRTVLLTSASEFENYCGDGGCSEPCEATLSCGHACQMKCHPARPSGSRDPHDASQCKEMMSDMCSAGHHRMKWECGAGRPPLCPGCVKENERLDAIAREALRQQKAREDAEKEHRRQMAELEAKLEAEKAAEARRVQAEWDAQLREERRRQAEEQRRRAEEERRRTEEERRRTFEARRRLLEEQQKREDEARERQRKERMKREEDERENRLQDYQRRMEETRSRLEAANRAREAERNRQEQERAARARLSMAQGQAAKSSDWNCTVQ